MPFDSLWSPFSVAFNPFLVNRKIHSKSQTRSVKGLRYYCSNRRTAEEDKLGALLSVSQPLEKSVTNTTTTFAEQTVETYSSKSIIHKVEP